MHSRLGIIPTLIAIVLLLILAIYAPYLTRIHPGSWFTHISLFRRDAPPKLSHKVWVDRRTGVYYCHGSKFYGKTGPGFYIKQGLALQKGFRPSEGSPCP